MSGPRVPWFIIRRELPTGRRIFLAILSFLLPLAIWCLVAYVPPFRWHPDIKLEIVATTEQVPAVYTPGDRVSRGFYPDYQGFIREYNTAVLEARQSGQPETSSTRTNQKLLRQLATIGIANGWMTDDQNDDDAAIYHLWRDLATGAKTSKRVSLSDENLEVIAKNWATLSALSVDYDRKLLPKEALLKLVPQGKSSTPVYLPAPHEVLITGFVDFTSEPENDKPSMRQRLLHSIKIVFLGFILAALFGVPLGVLCGTYDFFSRLFEPFIDFFRYMPAPTFSTLLVAIFLAHDAPKVALVFVGTFFQLVLVVSKTTRLLEPQLLEAAQTLGADNRRLVGRVIIPGILPDLYNDLRILLGWAWTWLVIAELIGVKTGLTEFIETQGRYRNFDRVFPVIIMIGFVGFATDQILSVLRGFLFPWEQTSGNNNHRKFMRWIMWLPRWLHRDRLAAVPSWTMKPKEEDDHGRAP